jgi:hypothetical protein
MKKDNLEKQIEDDEKKIIERLEIIDESSDNIPEVITGKYTIRSGAYNVHHDIFVKENGLLIIEKDVTLNFTNLCEIYVGDKKANSGQIKILGTKDYPAILQAKYSKWNGLTIQNTRRDNILQYATIRNSHKKLGAGISINHSILNLEDCTIENCSGSRGGGILAHESDIKIYNSTLRNNKVFGDGGGLSISKCDLIIRNVMIEGCRASSGGGIYDYDSEVKIVDSQIMGNQAWMGGGIHSYNSRLSINQSNISKNLALKWGGGISLSYSERGETQIVDTHITENQAKELGGGIDNPYNHKIHISGKSIIDNNTPDNMCTKPFKQYGER